MELSDKWGICYHYDVGYLFDYFVLCCLIWIKPIQSVSICFYSSLQILFHNKHYKITQFLTYFNKLG